MEGKSNNNTDFKTSEKISALVSRNYVSAAVLHYFGIDFYNHSHKTLAQTCRERGIDATILIKHLEEAVRKKRNTSSFKTLNQHISHYPIELVIDYLKNAHRIFMRRSLPYMSKLVNDCNSKGFEEHYKMVIEDLKIAFPLFAEDFIHHIFEEESSLFDYITLLDNAFYGKIPMTKVFYPMKEHSISRFLRQHQQDDDEMEGIRELTNNYKIDKQTPLLIKVLYSELKDFETELKIHADIENRILLPKALKLELKLKQNIAEKSKFN
ncbi:hemerythrin domain-containing protein [Bernardetia sp.]|uniref:hemerythrin domain-containing protein n=1 Tax=Bernardetia sp. TaxID=1937974 RepID=UPI0025B93A0F|nr:hemerythrin domain-containing protein [Bernardetia sp.]